MQTATLLRFLTEEGGEYSSERGTLAKELAVAIGVPVQEVHSAVRRLAKVGSIERIFAQGRTHSIRLVRQEMQPAHAGGVLRDRRNWVDQVDTIDDRLGPLESDVSHLGEAVERLTGILLQELERDRWAPSSNEGRANSMVALPDIEDDQTVAVMSRLADYKLELFYLPELADEDREELRDRAQAALEEALPGLAERLRDEGLLIVAEDDEAHMLL